jgi:UDP-N-acetylglucosamine enolpyruvyl transferase
MESSLREMCTSLRASTIESSQLAIRIKIVYLCLVGGERIGERR